MGDVTTKEIARKSGLFLGHAIIVVLVIFALAMGGFVWRLTSKPLDIGFAKPYLQEVLRDEQSGTYANMDTAVLHWPDLKGPLLLGLKDGEFYGPDGGLVFSVDEAAFSLNKARLLVGDIAPEALILRKPKLVVQRAKDNRFSVGIGEASPTHKKSKTADHAQNSNINLEEFFGQAGVLSALSAFEIDDASVVIDDAVLGQSWILPRLDIRFQKTDAGLFAVYNVDLPRAQDSPTSLYPRFEGELSLDWENKKTTLNGMLIDFDAKLLGEKIPQAAILAQQTIAINATMNAVFEADFSLDSADIQLRSQDGILQIADLSPEPVPYQDFGIQASYNSQSGDLNMREAWITLNDIRFAARGAFQHKLDDTAGDSLSGMGHLEIAELPHDQLAALWPEALKEDSAKEWLVDKMGGGVLKDLSADFHISARQDKNGAFAFDMTEFKAKFAFENMDVDYRAPLSPVTGAKGSGIFDLDAELLKVDVERAKLLDMNIKKAQLEFYNIIEAGAGTADLNIQLGGALPSVLRYIADEPIGVKPDFDVKAAQGRVDLTANIAFPTTKDLKAEQVELDIKGTMRDVLLPDVIKDLDLTGGPYDLSIRGNDFRLNGQGKLENRAITLDYREFLDSAGQAYSSKVNVNITADTALRTRMGIDLSEFIAGPVPVQVSYTQQRDGTATANVKADLKPARLFLDPFDYEKSVGQAGQATLTANLIRDDLQSITGLSGNAPGLVVANSSLRFRNANGQTDLASGVLGRFSVHETVGNAEFEIAPGGLLKIKMQGAFLDLSPFLDGEGDEENKAYDGPPIQASVSVDTMRTAQGQTVRFGKLYLDINKQGKFNQLEMDAVAGTGDIYMRYKPDASGKRVFRFEADDAGAALKAFKIYDKIRGGKMIVYGEPVRGIYDRNLIGAAEITDFKIVKAPTIAKIVSTLSLQGVDKMIQGDTGLGFTKLTADFDWLFRPSGSLLVLKNGRTSGNSLGLTFEGTFDNAVSKIDVSGTIVPLSQVNKAIGKIPLVGDILTGGSGGIFAATYTIKGEGKEPEVSVNPLSVLAPGILRRILFE